MDTTLLDATVFGAITKTAPQEDGSLIVYGKATGGDLDLDGQRCDPAWLSKAMPEWFRTAGNIREQHDSKRAVGKAFELDATDGGDHMIKARIVDPVAIAKTLAGVFTGFSIGVKNARVSKTVATPKGVIDDGSICEISLVDRPCLPSATLTVCKAAAPGMEVDAVDFDADRELVRVEELTLAADPDDAAGEPIEATVIVKKATPAMMPGAKAPAKKKPAGDGDAEDAMDGGDDEDTEDADGKKKMPAKKGGNPFAKGGAMAKATDVDNLAAPNHSQRCVRCTGEGHLWCAPEGFDRDFAVGLVNQTIEKADGGGGADDIEMARDAITIIGTLIASEAAELATSPSESWDIRLLLQAASALHQFIAAEQSEPDADATSPDMAGSTVSMSADPDAPELAPEWVEIQEKAAALGFDVDFGDDGTVTLKAADGDTADEANEDDDAAGEDVDKAADGDDTDDEADTADVTKAHGATPDPDLLVKALNAAFADEDSVIRKALTAIVEDSTKPTAEAITDVVARLDKVEQMATPGGPVLRRTETAQKNARKDELINHLAHWRSLESGTTDRTLQESYAAKAAEIDSQIRAL